MEQTFSASKSQRSILRRQYVDCFSDMKIVVVYLFLLFRTRAELQLVQIFFNHGSRTPTKWDMYATDPYKMKDFSPDGWGELTNIGKAKAYQLGENLRTRYNAFLGDMYYPGMVHLESAEPNRNKVSALLVAAGLFPPSNEQKWNEKLPWNPIAYTYNPEKVDFFLRGPRAYCPAHRNENDKVHKSEEVKKILKENEETLDYISKYAGEPVENFITIFRIHQTLYAENEMGLELPDWTKKIYPEPLQMLASKLLLYENYNDQLKRLNGGRLLQKVVANVKEKMKKLSDGRSMYLYAANLNTLVALLSALDVFQPHVPKFSAAVIFELHSNDTVKTFFTKVLYINSLDKNPEELKLAGCGLTCPLDKFLALTKPLIADNYTEECESPVTLD